MKKRTVGGGKKCVDQFEYEKNVYKQNYPLLVISAVVPKILRKK